MKFARFFFGLPFPEKKGGKMSLLAFLLAFLLALAATAWAVLTIALAVRKNKGKAASFALVRIVLAEAGRGLASGFRCVLFVPPLPGASE